MDAGMQQNKSKIDLHDSVAEIRWSVESVIMESAYLPEPHGESAYSQVTRPSPFESCTSPSRPDSERALRLGRFFKPC